MRIRPKKWAAAELAACPYYVADPAALRGQWRGQFARENAPLHAEFGCGKGVFIAQMAALHPEVNYVAADIKRDILGVARRNVAAQFSGGDPANLRLLNFNVDFADAVFGPSDRIERIYLNFPNPWPKERHRKRRLTHPRLLAVYGRFLAPGGEIHLKTDDRDLFLDSLGYFAASGFEITCRTDRLLPGDPHASPRSEHQQQFEDELGLPTHFCIAVRTG